MESQDAEHAVPHAQDSATGAGRTRLQPQLNFSSRIKFLRAKKRRTLWMRGAAVWGPGWGIGGVDSVQTLGLGLGRTGAGLGRIPYVSAGGPCLQGLEPGSSHTSGTCFPCSGAGGPLSVHNLFTAGPLRGLFCSRAVAVAEGLISSLRAGVCPLDLFMDPVGLGNMT